MFEKDKHLDSETLKLYAKIKNKSSSLPLPEQELIKKQVEEHLESCMKCSARLHMTDAFHQNEKKYTKRTKIRRNVIYTTSVVIIGFILAYNQPWQSFYTEEPKIANETPVEKGSEEKLDKLISEYITSLNRGDKLNLIVFAESQNFNLEQSFYEDEEQEIEIEELITRSPAEIKNIIPKDIAILTQPIRFKWDKTYTGISIVIKDNKKRKVWEASEEGTIDSLTSNVKLEPGVYYWSLRTNEELVTKRKFFIID